MVWGWGGSRLRGLTGNVDAYAMGCGAGLPRVGCVQELPCWRVLGGRADCPADVQQGAAVHLAGSTVLHVGCTAVHAVSCRQGALAEVSAEGAGCLQMYHIACSLLHKHIRPACVD
jgi:hypothetical protein